ncbi:hypothetical protein AAHB60_06710 [Pseudomonas aeruginosa]
MLQTIDRSFIGEGIIHARLYGSQEPFLPLWQLRHLQHQLRHRPQDAAQLHGRRRQQQRPRARHRRDVLHRNVRPGPPRMSPW